MKNPVDTLKEALNDTSVERTDAQKGFLEMLAGLAANPLVGDAKPVESDDRDLSQSLIVNFKCSEDATDAFFKMDELLDSEFNETGSMIYDGHELAMDMSDNTLFFYGPNAEDLMAKASPLMLRFAFMKGAQLTRRYGQADDASARQVRSIL